MTNLLARSLGAVACLLGCTLVWSCSNDCKQGKSECVSNSLIRTCVPGNSGSEWLVSQCGANEVCAKAGTLGADAGSADAGTFTPSTEAACVGNCKVGQHECVSDALARYCVTGGVWQIDPCAPGQACTNGACGASSGDGGVRLCAPGTKTCATNNVAKVCDADGSSWIDTPCAASQVCKAGACTADPKSSCDDADSCLDNKTAIRCQGQAMGFQLVKCDGDTYCEGGRCRGSVCALGSVCSGSNQIRTCKDGTSFTDSECGVNQVCQQDKDTASCAPLQCMPGTTLCGDPRDAKVDAKQNFTSCVNGTGSGIPEWVKGTCDGSTTCNPMLVSTGNPCSQNCTKGAQRCAADANSGINDGIETCGDDANWGASKTCNPASDGRLQCVVPSNPDASQLPKALCAEPICAWISANASAGATGACENAKLRTCQPDGTLSDAAACGTGICRTKRSTTTADGRMPGACDTTSECKDGEEECANTTGAVTPRYRTCVKGRWSVELGNCDNDGDCYTKTDDQGMRSKLCGAECSPGNRRCNGSGQLQQCDDQGKWGAGSACAAGTCKGIGNNDAACTLDCLPGTKLCAGSTVMAPDGLHAGTTQQITCGANGLRGAAKNCDEGAVCRLSNAGAALGCVACIGPNTSGGNDEGLADSRCDPADTTKLQDCGSDNNWQDSRACGDGKRCASPSSAVCGNCTGAHGTSILCSQTNIAAEQICNSCMVATSSGMVAVSPCSQAAITATAMVTNTTCVTQAPSSLGAPSSWGGTTDCCASAQTTAGMQLNSSCASLGYGTPGSWGGTTDCCAGYQLGSGAASFAFCN